jgi:MFS transporter, CP family, cyanate transporter
MARSLASTPADRQVFRMATRTFFLIALLLVAANLRASLTGVGPLLTAIQAELSLTATAAGLLGSLPLLMFAVFAPLARLGERFGTERLVLGGLVALVAGILLRSEGHVISLFAGTAILGAAIAMTNVLVPALVKQHYPERIPALTSAYATAMQVFASLASGVAVPLALVLPGGWRSSLAAWAVLGVVAIVCWLPQLRAPRLPVVPSVAAAAVHPPWRRTVAWQITGFLGLQSTLFYTAISWYPAYLHDFGYSAAAAGWLLTIYQAFALLAGMVVPLLIRRFADQRLLAVGVATLGFTATCGMWLAPGFASWWMMLLGIGAGPSLILSLSFIGLRSGSASTAAALSLMTQALGYFIAMLGPLAFGLVHDLSGGWTAPLIFLMAVAVGQGFCGLGAGRRVSIP